MGTHLRVLSDSFPMSTNMTGFGCYQKSLRSCALDRIASASEGLIKNLKGVIVKPCQVVIKWILTLFLRQQNSEYCAFLVAISEEPKKFNCHLINPVSSTCDHMHSNIFWKRNRHFNNLTQLKSGRFCSVETLRDTKQWISRRPVHFCSKT